MSDKATRGWAVVTGASSGLGVEFARQLAKRGHDVIVTARRRDRLESVAKEIEAAHGVRALVVEADLATRDGAASLVRSLDAQSIVPSVLINNAGFGLHGLAIDLPLDRSLEQIDLNVHALTHLSLAIGAKMAARGSGAILNVASVAAFQPDPYFAVYGATKAYVVSFSRALSWELAKRGVHVAVVCPGATRTEFFEVGGAQVGLQESMFMSAEECVRIALRSIDARRSIVVTGFMNALAAFFGRISPQGIATAVSAWMMRPQPKALPPKA